jgi:probable rRNA maturation factor
MAVAVEVQLAAGLEDGPPLPSPAELREWAALAVGRFRARASLTVRVVGERDGARLNEAYRRREGPTNVLAFPFEPPPGLPDRAARPLGDVVVCAPVAAEEAAAQGKELRDHCAHLVIHGALHLLGFDHVDPEGAERMEELERELLRSLSIEDPYVDG